MIGYINFTVYKYVSDIFLSFVGSGHSYQTM